MNFKISLHYPHTTYLAFFIHFNNTLFFNKEVQALQLNSYNLTKILRCQENGKKRLFCSRTREGVKGASPIAWAETRQNWRQNMMYVTNQNEKNSTVYKAGITKYKICHECSPWRLLQQGHLRFLFISWASLSWSGESLVSLNGDLLAIFAAI